MTPPGGGEPVAPGDEESLGEPIAELRDVSVGMSDQFAHRVRGRIEQRVLAGEFLELIWTAPIKMLFEFLRWPYEMLQRPRH